jgi:hypothetical protein
MVSDVDRDGSAMVAAEQDRQAEKVRENRVRRVAERRGYTLSKSRRRDPLATDYGQWQLSRGSLSAGRPTFPVQNVGPFDSLDDVEAFLDGKLGPAA